MNFAGTIVGLPRSRTFWFSELLTYGDAHCFHDFHAYKYPVPIRKRLFNASFTPWIPHTGNIVVIERDRAEAEESFINYLDSPDTVPVSAIFDAAESHLKMIDGLRIDYNDINGRILEILQHLGIDLPMGRIEEYLSINLNSSDTSEEMSKYAYA